MDLVQFLRARLDEDWRLAWESGCGGRDDWVFDPEDPWNGPNGPRDVVRRATGGFIAVVDPDHGKYGAWNARHIAHYDPTRVLAEVEAKRKLLTEYAEVLHNEGADYEWAGGWASGLGKAVALLALPYADHPDYRDTWRP
ncbi:DUF6221 family protein [Streptomyces hydrogenans]|uniref:DUF6221 family protein n=1 Tax=Streptomyces hydrogenans TaxID=1873719 RepID=UPI0035DA2010